MRRDLIEAYIGFYQLELAYASDNEREEEAIALIKAHSAKERLTVYLQWNGIFGYTLDIYAIATGEVE